MYVRPISTRLLSGMLTPAIRAKVLLPLPLLVSWVRADDEDPTVAADDLALLAHRLYRRSYLHDPFRTMSRTGWLWWPGRPPLPCPRSARRARIPRGPERDEGEYQTPPTRHQGRGRRPGGLRPSTRASSGARSPRRHALGGLAAPAPRLAGQPGQHGRAGEAPAVADPPARQLAGLGQLGGLPRLDLQQLRHLVEVHDLGRRVRPEVRPADGQAVAADLDHHATELVEPGRIDVARHQRGDQVLLGDLQLMGRAVQLQGLGGRKPDEEGLVIACHGHTILRYLSDSKGSLGRTSAAGAEPRNDPGRDAASGPKPPREPWTRATASGSVDP